MDEEYIWLLYQCRLCDALFTTVNVHRTVWEVIVRDLNYRLPMTDLKGRRYMERNFLLTSHDCDSHKGVPHAKVGFGLADLIGHAYAPIES